MAIRNGLEPSTSSVTGWHSNQLNYRTACPETPSDTKGFSTHFYSGNKKILQETSFRIRRKACDPIDSDRLR